MEGGPVGATRLHTPLPGLVLTAAGTRSFAVSHNGGACPRPVAGESCASKALLLPHNSLLLRDTFPWNLRPLSSS